MCFGTTESLLAIVLVCADAFHASNLMDYLLDDTNLILTVNVKQLVATPAFKKDLRDALNNILKKAPLQKLLQQAEVDPFKQIDRVTLITGRSCYRPDVAEGRSNWPFVVIEGQFDFQSIHRRMEQLAKEQPNVLKVTKLKGKTFYEIPNLAVDRSSLFWTPLDRTTIVASGWSDQIEKICERPAGWKRDQVSADRIKKMFDKLDLGASASFLGQGSTIAYMALHTVVSAAENPKKAQRTVKLVTFGDLGIDDVKIAIRVGDTVEGKGTIVATDGGKAAELNRQWNSFRERTKALPFERPELARAVGGLQKIKITLANRTMKLEATCTASELNALVTAWFSE